MRCALVGLLLRRTGCFSGPVLLAAYAYFWLRDAARRCPAPQRAGALAYNAAPGSGGRRRIARLTAVGADRPSSTVLPPTGEPVTRR
jgi:hypothetical protein